MSFVYFSGAFMTKFSPCDSHQSKSKTLFGVSNIIINLFRCSVLLRWYVCGGNTSLQHFFATHLYNTTYQRISETFLSTLRREEFHNTFRRIFLHFTTCLHNTSCQLKHVLPTRPLNTSLQNVFSTTLLGTSLPKNHKFHRRVFTTFLVNTSSQYCLITRLYNTSVPLLCHAFSTHLYNTCLQHFFTKCFPMCFQNPFFTTFGTTFLANISSQHLFSTF